MLGNIHFRIIKNLFFGGLIIATLVAAAGAFLALERIDGHVAELAIKESARYTTLYNDVYQTHSKESLSQLSKAVRFNVDHDVFVFIEIYDQDTNKIIEESVDDIADIKHNLENTNHKFPMKGKIEHVTFEVNGQLYVKVMVPLMDLDGNRIIGHFEGIFHVHPEKFAEIKKQVIFNLVQSIVIVLMTAVLLYPIILFLNKDLIKRTKDLLESNINTLRSLGNAIAKRDSDTNAHNYRVTIISVAIAENAGFKQKQIKSLIKGAFLHDIGKIGTSDIILLKPGKLTDDEFKIMQKHVIHGVEIIKNNSWLADAEDVVRFHHEKYDGSGYLSGLKGEDIPTNARIFALADVFDALTSKRPYKEPFTLEKSISILQEGSGSHFDPELLTTFLLLAKKLYPEISWQENEAQLSCRLDTIIKKYFAG